MDARYGYFWITEKVGLNLLSIDLEEKNTGGRDIFLVKKDEEVCQRGSEEGADREHITHK